MPTYSRTSLGPHQPDSSLRPQRALGRWIAEKRALLGITQSQLARRAEVSTSYISTLERDEPRHRDGAAMKPSAEKMYRIGRALGLTRKEANDLAKRDALPIPEANPAPARPFDSATPSTATPDMVFDGARGTHELITEARGLRQKTNLTIHRLEFALEGLQQQVTALRGLVQTREPRSPQTNDGSRQIAHLSVPE